MFELGGYHKGNPAILAWDKRIPKSAACDQAFAMLIDKTSYALLSTVQGASKDSCETDIQLGYKLAVVFLKYHIKVLSVDTLGNIRVKVFLREHGGRIVRGIKPNLGKRTVWVPLGKGWFEEKEDE